jgi:hypothetical protein
MLQTQLPRILNSAEDKLNAPIYVMALCVVLLVENGVAGLYVTDMLPYFLNIVTTLYCFEFNAGGTIPRGVTALPTITAPVRSIPTRTTGQYYYGHLGRMAALYSTE